MPSSNGQLRQQAIWELSYVLQAANGKPIPAVQTVGGLELVGYEIGGEFVPSAKRSLGILAEKYEGVMPLDVALDAVESLAATNPNLKPSGLVVPVLPHLKPEDRQPLQEAFAPTYALD